MLKGRGRAEARKPTAEQIRRLGSAFPTYPYTLTELQQLAWFGAVIFEPDELIAWDGSGFVTSTVKLTPEVIVIIARSYHGKGSQ